MIVKYINTIDIDDRFTKGKIYDVLYIEPSGVIVINDNYNNNVLCMSDGFIPLDKYRSDMIDEILNG